MAAITTVCEKTNFEVFTNTQLSNSDYHNSVGISKSGLDYIAKSPAVYQWSKHAPRAEAGKIKTLDIGTALHTIVLEPHLFDDQFAILPPLNLRTSKGKEEKAAFYQENRIKTIITSDESKQLSLMAKSVLAHPAARFLVESDGDVESSIFWIDKDTEELCRIRPDKALPDHSILVDVKTTADINKFDRSIGDYRYDVQAAMYSAGYMVATGEPTIFVFLVVSTSVECGKYPVRVLTLDPQDLSEGYTLYRRDLETYHECHRKNTWDGIETIKMRRWAK